jgi:hypothetical protein
MARKVFYSFHYKPDSWRASKVRNIGAIEDNQPASDNAWETITKGGDAAIEKWIKEQMKGRTCTVVLIGQNTAGRKWIKHEIRESWSLGMGLLGIHIHNLTDHNEEQSKQGANPFDDFNIGGKSLSSIVKTYNPSYQISKNVRNYIAENLEAWIEEAIKIRAKY